MLKRAPGIMHVEIPTTELRLFSRVVRTVLNQRGQERATLESLFRFVRLIKPLTVARGELIPIIADELPARVRVRRDKRADGFELQRSDEIVLVVCVCLLERETRFGVARELPCDGQRRVRDGRVCERSFIMREQEVDQLHLMCGRTLG